MAHDHLLALKYVIPRLSALYVLLPSCFLGGLESSEPQTITEKTVASQSHCTAVSSSVLLFALEFLCIDQLFLCYFSPCWRKNNEESSVTTNFLLLSL